MIYLESTISFNSCFFGTYDYVVDKVNYTCDFQDYRIPNIVNTIIGP